jgi:hypothetical protein
MKNIYSFIAILILSVFFLAGSAEAQPLTGTKTIGSSGNYTSFTSAINALNLSGVGSGGVTFNVAAGQTFTEDPPAITATGTLANQIVFQKSGAGANPIIRPTGGAATDDAGIKIAGGDYITFDGIDITINTGTALEYGYYIYNASATNGAQNNTIKNSKITLDRANTSSFGIFQFTSTFPTNQVTGNNNYNKYYNITIENSNSGIWLRGYSSTYFDIGCEIGTTGSGTTTIGAATANDIGNPLTGTTVNGIRVTQQSGVKIFNTTIRNLCNNATTSRISGILLEISYGTSEIYNNKIGPVTNLQTASSTSNFIVTGMRLDVAAGHTVNVYNNSIFGLTTSQTTATTSSPETVTHIAGIVMGVIGAGTSSLYYNSIRLDANVKINSACVMSPGAIANTMTFKNNIFSNNTATQSGVPKHYGVMRQGTIGTLTGLDYNDYYIQNTGNGYAGYYTANRTSLADWRTATSQDVNSVSGNPGFTSATNLQIDVNNANCWNVNAGALPLASVSTDCNGNPRNTSVINGACDIGAYEFTPVATSANLTITNNFTDGGTSTITFAGVNIATITWHQNGGTLPTGLSAVFQPGVNPSNTIGGSKYANENFDITATNGSGYLYDFVYRYNLARLGTVSSEADLRIEKYSAGAWQQYTSTPNTTNKTISVTGLNSFSSFTFGDGSTPLPVQLASFSSSINGRDVLLSWKTDFENNNAGFDVERKSAGTDIWTKAGFVNGNGTTNTPVNYTFEDKKLNSGKYNYRLKQIDNNGNFTYHTLSSIVDVGLPAKFKLSQNYPNPFNPATKIDFDLPFDSKVSIVLYDITGKEVKTLVNDARTAGYYTIQFNASDLSSGTYFYRIAAKSNGADYVMTKKMMLVK